MMSRFSEFGLFSRMDEPLRPSEKDLKGSFYSTQNTQLLFKRAKVDVSSRVTYFDVTSAMDAVFRRAIRSEDVPLVSEMNAAVLAKLAEEGERMTKGELRYSERTFKNSNLPRQFLSRPSYDDDNDDDYTIELLRPRHSHHIT